MAKNKFKDAVEITTEIQNCYKKGLQALGKYSQKIEMVDNSKCNGSIDIDVCTTKKYPNENRWDYALSYNESVFFIEVHSAHTGEVAVVIKKLQWLKDWLKNKAPEINKLKANVPFYWIQSNGNHILKNSTQDRQLAQMGLRPISKLKLPIY